ncbi:hypothetical protein ACH5RR_033033 [Cinchona calisaya]|uniref:Uncharacterized protein n=1 Tax=Cinchona calisaya TaxID=153742 RepID=A0ABD2YJT8_9GENT
MKFSTVTGGGKRLLGMLWALKANNNNNNNSSIGAEMLVEHDNSTASGQVFSTTYVYGEISELKSTIRTDVMVGEEGNDAHIDHDVDPKDEFSSSKKEVDYVEVDMGLKTTYLANDDRQCIWAEKLSMVKKAFERVGTVM